MSDDECFYCENCDSCGEPGCCSQSCEMCGIYSACDEFTFHEEKTIGNLGVEIHWIKWKE